MLRRRMMVSPVLTGVLGPAGIDWFKFDPDACVCFLLIVVSTSAFDRLEIAYSSPK